MRVCKAKNAYSFTTIKSFIKSEQALLLYLSCIIHFYNRWRKSTREHKRAQESTREHKRAQESRGE